MPECVPECVVCVQCCSLLESVKHAQVAVATAIMASFSPHIISLCLCSVHKQSDRDFLYLP